MRNSQPARCLDLTRLISRVGRGPLTGVDRVELAYLTQLLSETAPVFGLVKTRLGYVLLDRSGMAELRKRVMGEIDWGPADGLSTMTGWTRPGSSRMTGRIEADLRRLCVARAPARLLGRMIRRCFPDGVTYLNVGHSNLSERVLGAFGSLPGAQNVVLVHDVIPLDFPQFQREHMAERFQNVMQRVGRFADVVIYNSEQTRKDAERYFSAWGRTPESIIAHLGTEIAAPEPVDPALSAQMTDPFFVCLGTIEPRKNHALLLKVWQQFSDTLPAENVPNLLIVGSRGWNNEAVFAALDTSPLIGHKIHEVSGLSDGMIVSLLQQSSGLLFPSFAEGFGLPATEAAALGVPIICGHLPVFSEVLGDYPVYVETSDAYLWGKAIQSMAKSKDLEQQEPANTFTPLPVPTWEDHFNTVLKVV